MKPDRPSLHPLETRTRIYAERAASGRRFNWVLSSYWRCGCCHGLRCSGFTQTPASDTSTSQASAACGHWWCWRWGPLPLLPICSFGLRGESMRQHLTSPPGLPGRTSVRRRTVQSVMPKSPGTLDTAVRARLICPAQALGRQTGKKISCAGVVAGGTRGKPGTVASVEKASADCAEKPTYSWKRFFRCEPIP